MKVRLGIKSINNSRTDYFVINTIPIFSGFPGKRSSVTGDPENGIELIIFRNETNINPLTLKEGDTLIVELKKE